MENRNPLKIYENDNSSIVKLSDGKIPPQAIDLEEAVIGAMLIDEKGVLVHIINSVNINKHAEDILKIFKNLGGT